MQLYRKSNSVSKDWSVELGIAGVGVVCFVVLQSPVNLFIGGLCAACVLVSVLVRTR